MCTALWNVVLNKTSSFCSYREWFWVIYLSFVMACPPWNCIEDFWDKNSNVILTTNGIYMRSNTLTKCRAYGHCWSYNLHTSTWRSSCAEFCHLSNFPIGAGQLKLDVIAAFKPQIVYDEKCSLEMEDKHKHAKSYYCMTKLVIFLPKISTKDTPWFEYEGQDMLCLLSIQFWS